MLTLRSVKGSPLTIAELDNNFIEISNRIDLSTNQTITGQKTFINTPVNLGLLDDDNDVLATTKFIDDNISSSYIISNEYPLDPLNSYGYLKWGVTESNKLTKVLTFQNNSWSQYYNIPKFISSGNSYIIEKTDGSVWFKGYNDNNKSGIDNGGEELLVWTQVGITPDEPFINPTYILLTSINCFLMTDSLYGSGAGYYGNIGNGSWYENNNTFSQCIDENSNPITDVKEIFSNYFNTIILQNNGNVLLAGWKPSFINISTDYSNYVARFREVIVMKDAKKIALGSNSSICFEKPDGTVWFATGDYDFGGMGALPPMSQFYQIDPSFNNPNIITMALTSLIIQKSDGTVWGIGANHGGMLGLGHEDPVVTWTKLPSLLDNCKTIKSFDMFTVFETENDEVYVTNDNTFELMRIPLMDNFKELSEGSFISKDNVPYYTEDKFNSIKVLY